MDAGAESHTKMIGRSMNLRRHWLLSNKSMNLSPLDGLVTVLVHLWSFLPLLNKVNIIQEKKKFLPYNITGMYSKSMVAEREPELKAYIPNIQRKLVN
jgi:hypothetical protein